MKRILSLNLLALVLTACARDPQVTVINASGVPLNGVVIKGTGFEQAVGDLAPASSRTVSVKPTGETGLSIAFDKDGQRVTHGPSGYFEASGMYQVTATIRPDGSVAVTEDL